MHAERGLSRGLAVGALTLTAWTACLDVARAAGRVAGLGQRRCSMKGSTGPARVRCTTAAAWTEMPQPLDRFHGRWMECWWGRPRLERCLDPSRSHLDRVPAGCGRRCNMWVIYDVYARMCIMVCDSRAVLSGGSTGLGRALRCCDLCVLQQRRGISAGLASSVL